MPKDHKQHEKYLKLKKLTRRDINQNVKNIIKKWKWTSITIVKLANDQEMMLLDHWMLLCE